MLQWSPNTGIGRPLLVLAYVPTRTVRNVAGMNALVRVLPSCAISTVLQKIADQRRDACRGKNRPEQRAGT